MYTSSNLQYTFKIPVTVSSNGILEFDINNFYQQKIKFNGNRIINILTVKLVDNQGKIIELNGSEFEFMLKFSFRKFLCY